MLLWLKPKPESLITYCMIRILQPPQVLPSLKYRDSQGILIRRTDLRCGYIPERKQGRRDGKEKQIERETRVTIEATERGGKETAKVRVLSHRDELTSTSMVRKVEKKTSNT